MKLVSWPDNYQSKYWKSHCHCPRQNNHSKQIIINTCTFNETLFSFCTFFVHKVSWQRLVSLNKSFLVFYKHVFLLIWWKSAFWVYSICFFLCLLNRPSEKHSFSVDVLIIHQRIRNRNDEVQEVLSFATQEVQKITMTAVFRDHQHRTWKRAGKMTKIEQLWQANPSMTSFWCFYMVSSW